MTAAKKAAARPPKRAAPARSASSGAKAASHPAKKSVPKKLAPSGKRAGPASNKTAPKRAVSKGKQAAPASKRAVPAGRKATRASKGAAPAGKKPVTTGKKVVPAGRKAGASAGTASPKKAAPEAKKATGATKSAPVTSKAPSAKKVAPAPKRPTVGPYAKEPKFLEEQGALLAEERSIYKGQAVDLRAEADSLALEREPGDVQFDEESGEGGTVTVDRERNLALSAQAAAAVEEIDDALRKIERKAYGSCERCYQPIPKARLRALPFARLCVACKSGGLSRR